MTRRIEEFDNPERRDMVSGEINGCAPLFLACRNGSAEVVEYLVTRCGAPIEQKGQFEVRRRTLLTMIMVTCDLVTTVQVEEEGVRHSVTPLWCAAVSGRLGVVRVLLR